MKFETRMAWIIFFVAAGGILFEIFLGAFGSYLFGDSVRIFGITTGTYLFFMGVGAYAIRPDHRSPLRTLILVEVGLVLLHLLSPIIIWTSMTEGTLSSPLFWGVLALSGTAVGTEIPLVLALMRERQGTSDASVHWVLASDYLGALVASLLFGFFLLPSLGLFSVAWTAALLGALGILVLAATYGRKGWTAIGLLLSLVTLAGIIQSPRIQEWLEGRWYRELHQELLVHHEWTGYSELALTSRSPGDLTLYLDRQYQWSLLRDLDYYHESLAVPAALAFEAIAGRPAQNVLILGGGDGFLAERLLSIFSTASITIVDIDPRISRLAREIPEWRNAGGKALERPEVHLIHEDAYSWVAKQARNSRFDLVFLDLPDPRSAALARFFTTAFFLRLRRIAPQAVVAIQSSSEVRSEDGARRYVCALLKNLKDSGAGALGIEGKEQDYFTLATWAADSSRLRRAVASPKSQELKRLSAARWLDSPAKLLAWSGGIVLDSASVSDCAGAPRHTFLKPGILDL